MVNEDDENQEDAVNNLFKGVTYYLVGDISSKVKSLLDKHGAKMDSYLSEMVSHVIADTTDADDYSEAKELFELPIVSSDWVILSVQCGKQLPMEAFALEGRLFSKVVATPLDLETQDVLSVWGMIKYHGGKCQLHLDDKTTHLITASVEGVKYVSALEKSANRIKIVTPDWVVDTITQQEAQDETVYHPRLIEYPNPEPSPPPPLPSPPPPLPQQSLPIISGEGTPASFENVLKPAAAIGAGNMSKSPIGDDRMDIDLPNAKEVLARKISSRMGGKTPSEATTPEKMVTPPMAFHPINSPGGPPPGVSVTSPVPAMGLRPRMDSANIRNTLRNITNRAVTPMNVPMRPAMPTGAVKMNPMLGMGMPPQSRPPPPDYPFPPRVPGPIPAGPGVMTPQAPSATPTPARTGPRYFGHDAKENVPPHLCLLGCVFVIVDYHNILGAEEITVWKKVIELHGGQVESSYNNRITHVVCSNQKSDIFKTALSEGKRVVTAFWLNDCLMQKKLLPPWQALHLPLSFNSEKPGFNQMISVTNFDGEERTRLKQMISAIGAKYTGYMTHHNSALICKKPGGMKFEKAKEWRIAVVNVQWLSDLVLGNMDALRLPVHVRYLQVGQGNEFHMDLNRVSHLLGGWKTPVRISKETWKKCGNPLSTPGQENIPSLRPPPPKKPRVDCSAPPPEVEATTPKILFTLYPKAVVNRLTVLAKQLGGVVVTNPRHCTHLVCPSLARTIKFFIAIGSVRFVVTKEWLEESSTQERFLGEFNYALKDEKGEKTLGCDLAESLRRAQSRPLFQGLTFHITPGVTPPVGEMKNIIESGGGIVVKHRPSVKVITSSMDEQENPKVVVITCLGDLHLCQDLVIKNIPMYNPELVLTGVMRQELAFKMFRITKNSIS